MHFSSLHCIFMHFPPPTCKRPSYWSCWNLSISFCLNFSGATCNLAAVAEDGPYPYTRNHHDTPSKHIITYPKIIKNHSLLSTSTPCTEWKPPCPWTYIYGIFWLGHPFCTENKWCVLIDTCEWLISFFVPNDIETYWNNLNLFEIYCDRGTKLDGSTSKRFKKQFMVKSLGRHITAYHSNL